MTDTFRTVGSLAVSAFILALAAIASCTTPTQSQTRREPIFPTAVVPTYIPRGNPTIEIQVERDSWRIVESDTGWCYELLESRITGDIAIARPVDCSMLGNNKRH